ncbi:MAG: ATP synthase subunit I [Terriglobia bacterium]
MNQGEPDLARAEARLPRWMMAGALVGAIAILATGHLRWALGFGLGAALAILNYYWLHDAIATLFDAGTTRVPTRVVAKFALRYPLAFLSIYLFYKTGWLPFAGILAGMFVPVAGVLLEAVLQVWHGLAGNSALDQATMKPTENG